MTGISIVAYKNYLSYKNLTHFDADPAIFDVLQQLAKPSESFLEYIQSDVRGIFPHIPSTWNTTFTKIDGAVHLLDEWGIEWKKPNDKGLYFDMCSSPMANDSITLTDVAEFQWPDPLDSLRFSTLKQQIDDVHNNGQFGMTMHGMTSGVLEMMLRIRGYENGLSDLISEPRIVECLLDRIVDIKISYWQRALMMTGCEIDVAVEADDLGTQNSLLMSPDIYRNLVKPRHKRLFTAIKHIAPHIKVFLHSCGAIKELIPDLIEVGVDILNPVQISAQDMDAKMLKRSFGKDLVFWGGGIDTQRTLPYGSTNEVREEVKRRIDILAPDGGFVFSAVHNIQADVPPQNLEAMLEELNR